MYDIRQFRPALYLLMLVGISGFAMTAEQPGLWCFAAAAMALNVWLVRSGRFRPLRRWLAATITAASLAYIINQYLVTGATPILLIGQFLVLLQLVKIYEQRYNRDYAQILMLSLLLMIAAMMNNTASLFFGLLLIIYLFLGLYTCLLFHLKVEADRVRTAQTLPPEKIAPAAMKQDQWHFKRSMRRITLLIAFVALSVAVIVFVAFPRGGGGALGQMSIRQPNDLSGFSPQMRFEQLAKITQNTQTMAWVKVWHNEEPVEGGVPLVLRGETLERYDNDGPAGTWQWEHTGRKHEPLDLHEFQPVSVGPPGMGDRWRQLVSLRPTGTTTLFAMPGAFRLTPHREMRLRIDYTDSTFQTTEFPTSQFDYEVTSSNDPSTLASPEQAFSARHYDRRQSVINPLIHQYALLPEVTGALASQRTSDETGIDTLRDEKIARAIEHHLRSKFTYTLDLSKNWTLKPGDDPMVRFLYEFKSGHCEYFAGAMTLLCQSLGMQAREVIGFKTDEYNGLIGQYVVRGLHAHAWVEVYTGPLHGWQSFDPTSSISAGDQSSSSAWINVQHFFNYLQYKWETSVVAYDNDSRQNILTSVEQNLSNGVNKSAAQMNHARGWWTHLVETLSDGEYFTMWGRIRIAILAGGILVALAAIAKYIADNVKLRRRAARIGLNSVPASQRLEMARQLAFYEQMMRTLERRQVHRASHQTVQEFSESLSFLPGNAYQTIRRLTKIYYRIRFASARPAPLQQRRLSAIVQRLDEHLPYPLRRIPSR